MAKTFKLPESDQYEVKHKIVGSYREGDVVSHSDLANRDYDVQHLLRSGAITGTNLEPTPTRSDHNPHVSYDNARLKEKGLLEEEVVEEETENDETEEEDESEDTSESIEYSEMSLTKLRTLAKERDIDGANSMSKTKLVAALQADDAD